MSKKTKAILIVLSITLFVIGLFIFSDFLKWFLIIGKDIKYSVSGVSDQFNYMLLFSLVIAAIPIVPFLLQLKTTKSILITITILLACVVIAVIIKRIQLLYYYNKFYVEIPGVDLENNWSLGSVVPVYYMFFALMIGILVLSILKSQKILFKEEVAI